MSNGGMDGFDWLQSFLPADSQPDYDLNSSNNAAYQTHPAFQDAEEVAKAAFMHQQAHSSYSFMRSTNPGTSHRLNSSQVYSRASSGQYRGNQHQQASSVYSQQSINPPRESSPYQPDRSHQLNPRPSFSVPSHYNSAAQAHQDAYRRPIEHNAQTSMAPFRSPRRPSTSIRNLSQVGQSFHTAGENTRPTASAQRMNSTTARATSTSQSPYQPISEIPDRHSQWPAQSRASQETSRPTAPVQMKHTTAGRPPLSQSSSHDQFGILPHNVHESPHFTAAQGARPTPLVQRTHTPTGSIHAAQSPRQSRSTTPPQNVQRLPQSARPTSPVQTIHTAVGSTQKPHSLHRGHSMIPNQNTQLSSSAPAQISWPAPPVHRTHTPITQIQESQDTHQRHPAIPIQTFQRSSQSHAPPNHHTSVDAGSCTPVASPKGFKSSAAPSTLEFPQLATPATGTSGVSNASTHNLPTNDVRSKPTSSGTDLAYVQPAIQAAQNRVSSPATPPPASTKSPPLFSAPAPISTHPAPPAQTAVALHKPEERQPQEEGRSQEKPPSTSPYQEPKQTSKQPLTSQLNEQNTPAESSTHMPNPSLTRSHSRLSYSSRYVTGSETSSASNKATARKSLSRVFPLPGASHSQTKRWLPTHDYPSGYMPPAKMQRLGNTQSQPVIIQNASSTWSSASPMPAVQPSEEQTRPRGPGKILKNRGHLIQPIRRSDALLKDSYDPATIARDVLIAAGKHPTEKHLNHHLDALRRNFAKIDYLSDLATFRWDIVDVKYKSGTTRMPPVSTFQPPPPPVPQSLHQPQSVSRDPAAPSNHVTISAPSQHVPSRDTPPNRRAAPPAPVRIDARPHAGSLSAWGTLPFKPLTYRPPQRAFPSNLPSGLPRIDSEPALPKSSHELVFIPNPPQPQQRQTTTSALAPNSPPSAKQVIPKSTSKPKPQGPTTKSQSDSSRAAQSPEARRLPQPQVVIPPSPDKMPTKKRPGRPSKSVLNHIEVAIPRELPVRYQVFPCKWEECAAELHNIDSVRAHVLKVHIPHSLICIWKDCDNKTPMAAAKMFEHVVNDHISKMAWALGDGPTVPVTAETDLTHPSDLGDQSTRKGTMVLPVDEHQIKAFSKAHGKATEKMKAQALLEAGRHWKQQIGPEMDWSDRRLLTPARQSRVHCGEMAFVAED